MARIRLPFFLLLFWAFAAPVQAGMAEAFAAYEAGDYPVAVAEFQALAEAGDVGAQYNLGTIYSSGDAVPEDFEEAAKWFRMAAEQGDPGAQRNLGYFYGMGLGVPEDHTEAARWYQLSALQGDPDAQDILGAVHASGLGVPQDYMVAYMWFSLAAAQGHPDSDLSRDLMLEKLTPEELAAATTMLSDILGSN